MSLAIIIPAYKKQFFAKALESLANQTNKNFTLYIGDDHSPFDLQSIVDNYRDKIAIVYNRFDYNMGAQKLVLQWKRCIELTQGEEWLWLFSDDDIADSNCVANFYSTRNENADRFDVYRFNTVTIDADDNLINHSPLGPTVESSEQMAYFLLKGQRGNSMPDHIFSRAIYDECGGFVITDYAQGADWATSILFSKKKGICIIQNSTICWRYSGSNISSTAYKKRDATLKGYLQFSEWLVNHFKYLKKQSTSISFNEMLAAIQDNLSSIIIHHYKGFNLSHAKWLYNFYRFKLYMSPADTINELIKIKRATQPTLNAVVNICLKVKRQFK